MREDRTTMNLRYDFTQEEIGSKGKELALLVRDSCQLEDNRRQVSAAYKEQLEAFQTRLKMISRQIDSGYEMRDVECAVQFDTPEPCKKTIVRMDTGEQVAIMPMTQAELQEEFNFLMREAEMKREEPPAPSAGEGI